MEHKVIHALFSGEAHHSVLRMFREGTCTKKIAFMLNTSDSVVRAILRKYLAGIKLNRSCVCHKEQK